MHLHSNYMLHGPLHTSSHFLNFLAEPRLTLVLRRTAAAPFFRLRIALWFIQAGYCPCSSRSVRRLYLDTACESSVSINDASPTTVICCYYNKHSQTSDSAPVSHVADG